MIAARHLAISGRVQGVGYRYYMKRAARELGIAGWVRNRSDGSVEAVVQGSAEQLDAIVAWARRGPPTALVAEVKVSERAEDAATVLGRFEVRPTE